jgi:hypothetical protein
MYNSFAYMFDKRSTAIKRDENGSRRKAAFFSTTAKSYQRRICDKKCLLKRAEGGKKRHYSREQN